MERTFTSFRLGFVTWGCWSKCLCILWFLLRSFQIVNKYLVTKYFINFIVSYTCCSCAKFDDRHIGGCLRIREIFVKTCTFMLESVAVWRAFELHHRAFHSRMSKVDGLGWFGIDCRFCLMFKQWYNNCHCLLQQMMIRKYVAPLWTEHKPMFASLLCLH